VRGQRNQLEVKLVGGGKVLDAMTDIGARNISFVREYLRAEGIRVVGEDLGGTTPRKVLYEPATGTARVKRLTRASDQWWPRSAATCSASIGTGRR